MIGEEYMIETLVDITPQNIFLRGSQVIDFHYKAGGLEIIISLDGVSPDFRVFFDWSHSFRVTDEGDLLKMLGEQSGKILVGIYKVEKSSYLEWFNDQSVNIRSKDNVAHYLIVTVNDVVDVLSSEPPIITNYSK
ncbi:hypothetical protein DRF02_24835 [Salmonella enterica subsp. salamae]|nr:hypothetical protein [Salmonella enterica subsp. salamae serovar Springs]ECC9297481.1 hypothetical protein [Salmonella enterica subsp. salamae]HCM1987537.1 hypothetical protein [Salmonella enterica subsp. salamae serovar 40:a:z39]